MAEKDILYITLSNLKCQGDFLCDQVGYYSRKDMLRKPFGAMVSSADQTPQAPVMFLLIIHYFERPASSVRLVKSIHLRAWPQILDYPQTISYSQAKLRPMNP